MSVFGYFASHCLSDIAQMWFINLYTVLPYIYEKRLVIRLAYKIHIRATCSAKCPSLYMISMRVLVHQSISVSQAG